MSMSMNDDVDDEQPKGRRREERDDDDDQDEVDDDEQDDGDDPDAGKSEADLRAELKSERAKASRLSKQGGRRAGALKEARKRIAELEGKTDDDPDEDDDEESKAGDKARKGAESKGLSVKDVERAVRKAEDRVRREVEAERTKDRITSRAETALLAAGASEKTAQLLLTRLDYEDLTLDKDGGVDGLDEAIDDLKSDFGDLFRSKRRRGERINGDDDRSGGGKGKPQSATQRQADMVLGRSRS